LHFRHRRTMVDTTQLAGASGARSWQALFEGLRR
jgi:hypothetical protein